MRSIAHTAGEEICSAVINLGRDLELKVVAEGVEEPEMLQRLRDMGCEFAQGYLFAKPLSAADLDKLLEAAPGWRLDSECA